jgi:hypothetical protein
MYRAHDAGTRRAEAEPLIEAATGKGVACGGGRSWSPGHVDNDLSRGQVSSTSQLEDTFLRPLASSTLHSVAANNVEDSMMVKSG